MSTYAEGPLGDFFDELDRTGVISDTFKTRLQKYALAISADAYDRGKEAGREISLYEEPENSLVVAPGQIWQHRILPSRKVTVESVEYAFNAAERPDWLLTDTDGRVHTVSIFISVYERTI